MKTNYPTHAPVSLERLSLNDAIAHADERADALSGLCAAQHAQLAAWLRELQERQKASAEPIYQWRERYEEGSLWDDCTKAQYDGFAEKTDCEVRILYTAPPAAVVQPVMFIDGDISASDAEKLAAVIREWDDVPAPVVPDERAAFNAWNNDENLPIAGVSAKNAAWLAWQARAALCGNSVLDVPPERPADSSSGDDVEAWFDEGWNACRAAMLQAGNHTEQHLDMVVHSGDDNEKNDCRLPFDQWLSQQNEPIDVDCGCVTTEAFYHWLRVAYEAGNSPETPDCWCRACRPVTMSDMRFVVCPECGNKRCPHANDHNNACTGSNEPGQVGSAYPSAPQQELK